MNDWNNETRIDIPMLHCIIIWHIIMSDIQRSDCFYRIFLVLSMSIILHYILNSKSLTSSKNSLKTGYYSRDTTQRKKIKKKRSSVGPSKITQMIPTRSGSHNIGSVRATRNLYIPKFWALQILKNERVHAWVACSELTEKPWSIF